MSKCTPGTSDWEIWGCLAQKVYEGGWKAKTKQQLIRRPECKIKEFDTNEMESFLEGVKAKLGKHLADVI